MPFLTGLKASGLMIIPSLLKVKQKENPKNIFQYLSFSEIVIRRLATIQKLSNHYLYIYLYFINYNIIQITTVSDFKKILKPTWTRW
ncbi:hypothetical protein JRG66_08935 [Salinimicrobium tongyeongense]|uniref:Uncharacterized protein n=1 Tax=Salinimicrobium tongyeongense TaxID=2809707 RepID=A0ABY6NML1_9FLAO|nr:hypothetical protein [Salinimicrobium tongyeongense]UZH54125.1 hypothetical protein JRG66_08935 [Salinimicrobium tongyeongense]